MTRSFLDFQVDHMTLLVDPALYPVAYLVFRNVFGAAKSDILYEKRKAWDKKDGDVSMTFAVRVGRSQAPKELSNTIFAVVQPSEPKSQRSHVREMLTQHKAAAHWQHIALRTPDLLAFHKHASERGVNFITPILKDADEDLIQVFSGEWYLPGQAPSGMFFEFVQRSPNEALIKKLEERNRESWFRDETFLGLYGEKEREYQSGKVTPFLDAELTRELQKLAAGKHLWQLTEADVAAAEKLMLDYGRKKVAA
jgi:hypothetical protein